MRFILRLWGKINYLPIVTATYNLPLPHVSCIQYYTFSQWLYASSYKTKSVAICIQLINKVSGNMHPVIKQSQWLYASSYKTKSVAICIQL